MKKFQSCFELSKALLMSDPELPLCEVKGGHIQLPATHFIINSNGPLDKQYAGCDPRRWAAFVARFTEQEETEDRSSISIASNQKLAGKIHQEIIAAVLAIVQSVDTWTAGPDVTTCYGCDSIEEICDEDEERRGEGTEIRKSLTPLWKTEMDEKNGKITGLKFTIERYKVRKPRRKTRKDLTSWTSRQRYYLHAMKRWSSWKGRWTL